MVVTLSALHRQPQKGRADGVNPVRDVGLAEFLRHTTALRFLTVEAVKGGGQLGFLGGIRDHVPCQLVGDEVIIRQVSLKGADHPVTPLPDGAVAIDLIAVAIRVAGDIEPLSGHALSIGRADKQAIDLFFICLGRFISEEGIELGERWWQAGEIKAEPAQP